MWCMKWFCATEQGGCGLSHSCHWTALCGQTSTTYHIWRCGTQPWTSRSRWVELMPMQEHVFTLSVVYEFTEIAKVLSEVDDTRFGMHSYHKVIVWINVLYTITQRRMTIPYWLVSVFRSVPNGKKLLGFLDFDLLWLPVLKRTTLMTMLAVGMMPCWSGQVRTTIRRNLVCHPGRLFSQLWLRWTKCSVWIWQLNIKVATSIFWYVR